MYNKRTKNMNAEKALVATNLHKSFADKIILDQENIPISPMDRIGLVGRNGSGKSTLIKILAGRELPDRGQVFNPGLSIGYLAQDFLLEGSQTVYEVATEGVRDIAQLLEEFDQMNSNFQANNLEFMERYNEVVEI